MVSLNMLHWLVLLTLVVSQESCTVQTPVDCPDDKDTLICTEVNTKINASGSRSFATPVCLNNYKLHIREGADNPFVEAQDGSDKCSEEAKEEWVQQRKGKGLKILGVEEAICAKEICLFKKGHLNCLPMGECKDATQGKDGFTCGPGYHLELQDTTKAWTTIVSHECFGSTFNGKKDGSNTESDLSKESIRCRKDRSKLTSCDVIPYFSDKECNRESKCTTPTIEANKVVCKSGTLQAVLDEWKDVNDFTVQCRPSDKQIVMVKGGIEYNPQMLRCRKDAVCDVPLAGYTDPNPRGGVCIKVTYSSDRKAVECAAGHDLEGQVSPVDPWFFVEKKIECLNDKMYMSRDYKKLRCCKPRQCKMEQFYNGTLCDEKLICKQPDSAFKCETEFKLEYFSASVDPLVWSQKIDKIVCESNKLLVHIAGAKSDIVPIGLRCSKYKGCDLNTYKQYNCDIKDECTKPIPTVDNKLSCDEQYELQSKEGGVWRAVDSISCPENAFESIIAGGPGIVIESARCVRKNIDLLFDATDCNDNQECTKATGHKSMTCEAAHTLQVKVAQKWQDVDSIAANSDKFTVNPDVGAQPERIRCVKMKKKIDEFFVASDCEEKLECKQATNQQNSLTCEADFALQVKITTIWQDVESITVNSDKLIVKNTDNTDLAADPERIRCAKVDIESYFDATNDCTKEELCTMADEKDRNSLKCDPDFALQVKMATEWKEVKSISVIKNKLTVTNEDNTELGTAVDGIRCVRMRCSICSNPCPNCTYLISFTPSTKWNECVSFGCGANSRTLIGTEKLSEEKMECHPENKEGESSWKKTDGSPIKGDIKCEKLCTLQSPLISSCEANIDCEKISFNDFQSATCSGRITRKAKTDQKVTRGYQLKCNITVGEWILKMEEGERKVETGDNVYCEYEDCDHDFCRDCVRESLCTVSPSKCDNATDTQVYRCPDGLKTLIGRTDDETKPRSTSSYFSCKNSKWFDNEGHTVDESEVIECQSTQDGRISSSSIDSTLLIYMIVLIIVILFVFILLAYIVCRMKGNGWLHTIVIDKVRGKKKKKGGKDNTTKKSVKGSSSLKRSSKGDSSYTTKNTEKEPSVPAFDQNSAEPVRPQSGEQILPSGEQIGASADQIGPSAEQIRPSGEKVSAEQISATGAASAEGFSAENGGGAVIPNESEAPPPKIPQTINA